MFFKSLLPAFLWALFILIICGIPGSTFPRVDFLAWLKPDKLVHLFVFGLLAYLLMRGFNRQETVIFLKTTPGRWTFFLCIMYACLIELLQEYVFVDRTGDLRDVIADALGALVGMGYYNYTMKKRLPS